MKETIVIKSYKNEKGYRRDAKKMAKKGYSVMGVENFKENQGCGLLGCKALIFLPLVLIGKKPKLVVTYIRNS